MVGALISRNTSLEDLVTRFLDALNTTGHVTQSYHDEVEHNLLRIAAAKAARSLGRPTRSYDRPGRIHLSVTDWGDNLPHIRAGGTP
jgi:hypothetical protein